MQDIKSLGTRTEYGPCPRNYLYRIIWILVFTLFPLFSYAETKTSSDKLTIKFFYSFHCKVCLKLENKFFPNLKEKYKDKIIWQSLETSQEENNLLLLVSLAGRFKKDAVTPAVFVGDTFLTGRKEIKAKLNRAIIRNLNSKNKSVFIDFSSKKDLLSIFNKLSFLTVLGSGLIDGINPCAFAVIVFFVSFLAVYGYRKRQIAWVGAFYCLGVFLAYLFIGLGFFRFLYSLSHIYFLINGFYYFVAIFCFILCGLATYDFIRFKKTKQAEDSILQLPQFLKKQINFVIGHNLRNKSDTSIFQLAINSFIVGVLVSILEAVCTGQVYLPTIVFILKNTQLKLKAFIYLILYNLMFVLPLVIIFVLSLLGFSSQKFNTLLKNNLGTIKIFMAVLFLVLGVLTLLMK